MVIRHPRRHRILAVALALLTTIAAPAMASEKPRIIDGSEVSPATYAASWPWLVVVLINTPREEYECTGSLIAPQWVLTAAHCTESEGFLGAQQYAASEFTIEGGSPDEDTMTSLGAVDAVETDPAYDIAAEDTDQISASGDVGLLHLASPVSEPVYPALATASPVGPVAATALGWGLTAGDGETSPTLRSVEVTVSPKGAGQLYNPGPKGTCGGDSGGPLVEGGIVIGTTSYGDDACTTDNYYNDTASVTPWILQTAQSLPGRVPAVAAPPRFTGAHAVRVWANVPAVPADPSAPTAPGARVTCTPAVTHVVRVPSRATTACTARSPGGTSTTSYSVIARHAAHAVDLRRRGRRASSVRRGATVALSAGGFGSRALVTVRWGLSRRVVRASKRGKVAVRMRAPHVAGRQLLTLTGDGATIVVRAQRVRITR